MKLALTAAILSLGSICASPAETCSLRIDRDGKATLQAVVVENHHDCAVDGSCYLTLRCEGSDFVVDYAGSEGGRPTRNDSASVAWNIRKGDSIEAYGEYTKGKNRGSIDIFSQENFWIKIRPPK